MWPGLSQVLWTVSRKYNMRGLQCDEGEKNQQASDMASQLAQWVKNLPAMQEMTKIWVQLLSWKDPLEKIQFKFR